MQLLTMTTATAATFRAGTRPERAPWAAPMRRLGWPVSLGLLVASMGLLLGLGYGPVVLLSVGALALSIPLMHVMPQRLPPLNHLGTRNLVQVEVETRRLVGFALLYPILLAGVVIAARAVPASLIPGVASPLLSPLYVVGGKVLLLGVPAVVFAARLGQLGRQLGLRRINSRWRWLGPVVPFALILVSLGGLGAIGTLPLAPLAYLLAFPLAAVAIGFPEEAFYRVLLQTRLELLLGSRSGIATASVLYGLMQIPVRFAVISATIEPNLGRALLLSVGIALGYQAVLGVLYGYIWMRYRNAWVNLIAHSLFDAILIAGLIAH